MTQKTEAHDSKMLVEIGDNVLVEFVEPATLVVVVDQLDTFNKRPIQKIVLNENVIFPKEDTYDVRWIYSPVNKGKCPVCFSPKVTYSNNNYFFIGSQAIGQKIDVPCSCGNCAAKWTERYGFECQLKINFNNLQGK